MRKIKAVEIHDVENDKIRTIYSGDNKSWKKLDKLDQSMILEVLRHHCLITSGKFVYYPIFEKRK